MFILFYNLFFFLVLLDPLETGGCKPGCFVSDKALKVLHSNRLL